MKAFLMIRDDDAQGNSGRVVAEGAIFSDGRVALRWLVPGKPSSTVTWDSIEDAMLIHEHGYDGKTSLAIAPDIPWPPGHAYEHNHRWRPIEEGGDLPAEGPVFCTDCGAYERRKPVEVEA